ncbi:aspartate/glutamate racemase family protein [Sphaerotilus mobilis]|uniref:Maleate isomerase n=1 Tax=Sphaerotilus mobilis TaxID=47994 RepID=A0A4Q7LLC7_9BURK|nr:aspartate/glutamate racemase family protein [Sphaerotilus mobilis]RZS54993.1 maleate isomerase [Sphaerotilus mobilis]
MNTNESTDAPTPRRLRLGILTPSSNTALEPLTSAMVSTLPGVTAHFSRFRVTHIGLGAGALGQFDPAPMLAAAELLADARVDAIGWSGTAAGWRGFDTDVELCARIEAATGIRATTSILALNERLLADGVRRLALVTPYTADVQARIVAHYREIGIETVAERHLGIHDNFSFGTVTGAQLDALVAEVAASRPDAVVPYCTNLVSTDRAAGWERRHGCTVYDTTTTVVWKMLKLLDGPLPPAADWGRWLIL